jgi:hypothetical protein
MFKRKESGRDRIDSVASEIARSAALTDQESESVVDSSLFYSRLRSRIESEKSRARAPKPRNIAVAFAISNMKLAFSGLMIVAAVAFWLIRIPAISGSAPKPPDLAAGLTACSISATSACAISTGDVLQLLISNNIQELPK